MELTDIILMIVAGIVAIIGLGATLMSRPWASLVAFGALCVLFLQPVSAVSVGTLLFWGIASLIATAICVLLPGDVQRSRMGVAYLLVGTVAGAFVGLIISTAGMIVGAVLGAVCAAVAYSRTPAGRTIDFPSAKFFNYLCAKGLPIVVTVCEVTITVVSIIIFCKSMT